MLEALDATAARKWAGECISALETHRETIDRINVYPVADGDTGTNLLNTMRAAAAALRDVPDSADLGEVLGGLASGAFTGARGNSGMLLAQMLRGVAERWCGLVVAGDVELRDALRRAHDLATRAVAEPAEGTVLSVLRAAEAAIEPPHGAGGERESGTSEPGPAGGPGGLASAVAAAGAGARAALRRTPQQLAVLGRFGVVDAGGHGLVVLLEALDVVVRGSADPPEVDARSNAVTALAGPAETDGGAAGPIRHYEVMYLLGGTGAEEAAWLRQRLRELGDCVSVVGDGAVVEGGQFAEDGQAGEDGQFAEDGRGSWVVHVHCRDAGAAIEHGMAVGRPRRVSVHLLEDGAPASGSGSEPAPSDGMAPERAVLACVRGGEPLAELFRAEGARVVELPDDRPLETADVLAALSATGDAHVVLLPNRESEDPLAAADDRAEFPGVGAVVEDAARQAVRAGRDVVAVPAASPVQGLAALAVHDPRRRAADDVVAMAEAAAATRRGELCYAWSEALTWAGRCHPGDVLGLVDGEVVLLDSEPVAAARRLADRMLSAGGELVTALTGDGAPVGLVGELERHLHAGHPEVEFASHAGGRLGAVLLLGVE